MKDWINNLPFRRKVQIPLGIIAAMILALVATALFAQQRLGTLQQQFSEEYLPILSTVLEADRDMHQALVAERTALLTQAGTPEYAALLAERRSNVDQARQRIERVRALDTGQQLTSELDRFFSSFARWKSASAGVLTSYARQGSKAEALALSRGQARREFDAAREVLNEIAEREIDASDAAAAAGEVARERTRFALLAVSAVGLALCLLVFLVLPGIITTRIRRILDRIVDIAEGDGDLRQRLDDDSRDEIGQLAAAFNRFADRIHDLVTQVKESALAIAGGVSEIASGNLDLSQRTEEQAASLEETASSMNEMTSTVRQNAQNAREASLLADSSRKQAEDGGHVVSQTVAAMADISQSSNRISDIIGVVDEIAFQTNLLALNAAVEAARAGEQGRGFAVVAAEVRSLAQRSAEAAKEIKELILESVQKVESGAKLVDQSGEMLTSIVDAVTNVSAFISDIDCASQEQAQGIEQVNRAVEQMDQMTQQNSALVEQATAAARSLEDQAQTLRALISAFKLDESRAPGAAGGATGRAAVPRRHDPQAPRPGRSRPAPVKAASIARGSNLAEEWHDF